MPQEWDEKGNAVTQAQAWDEHGNPISTAMQGPQPIPRDSSIGPDTRGLLQKANDWWTRKPVYDSTLSSPGISPRERTQRVGQAAAVASIPAAGASLIAAPIAATLGIGGALAGSAGGAYLGSKAGKALGAPELGEDIGGLAGGFLGGSAGGLTAPKARTGISSILGPEGSDIRGAIPTDLGKFAVKKLFPPPTDIPIPAGREIGAPLPSTEDFYANRGEELNKAAGIDRKVRTAQTKGIAPPVENPFPGATSSAENLKGNPTPYSQLPPVPEGPQTKIPVVQKSGSPASLGKSTILDPNNLPPDEVTHQSVPWPELKKQAMGGNKFAIDEVIRRGREAEIPGLAGAVGRQKPYPRIGR